MDRGQAFIEIFWIFIFTAFIVISKIFIIFQHSTFTYQNNPAYIKALVLVHLH